LGTHSGLRHGELLARIEYLTAENRILKGQLKGQLKLSDAERATLAPLGCADGSLGRRPALSPKSTPPILLRTNRSEACV
jgi:hypothetical protein